VEVGEAAIEAVGAAVLEEVEVSGVLGVAVLAVGERVEAGKHDKE